MCKSLYSNFFGLSTLSDSNPVPRRFCPIDSYLTLFSLSLTLALNNQPTNQPLAITKTRHPPFPPKKTTRSKGRKERKKKTYQTGLLHIHTYIHKSTERNGMSTKKGQKTKEKQKTLLSDDLTYGREEVFSFSFSKKQMAYLIDPFCIRIEWELNGNGTDGTKRNEKTVPSQFFVVMLGGKMFFFFLFCFVFEE